MKKIITYVVALLVGTFLVLLVGCDGISAVVKDKKNRAEKYINEKTIPERARVKIHDTQRVRADLKKTADQFLVNSGVAVRRITRLEEEKERAVEAFRRLQEIAKKAGLPKRSDASAEDMAKTIPYGTRKLTGEEIYRILTEYKAQVEKTNAAVERERKQSDFYGDRAGKIRSRITTVDNNLAEMEHSLADYEISQKLLAADDAYKKLGLSDDKLQDLLNIDGIRTELQSKVDEADVRMEISDQESRGADLKRELINGSSFSITEDDLI